MNKAISVSNSCTVSEAFSKSIKRETRLIDASSNLALAREALMPPDDWEEGDDSTRLSLGAVHGVINQLFSVGDVISENLDAFCRCHEGEQEGLLFKVGIDSPSVDEFIAGVSHTPPPPNINLEQWTDGLPEKLKGCLEMILSEFEYEKYPKSETAEVCRWLASLYKEGSYVRKS